MKIESGKTYLTRIGKVVKPKMVGSWPYIYEYDGKIVSVKEDGSVLCKDMPMPEDLVCEVSPRQKKSKIVELEDRQDYMLEDGNIVTMQRITDDYFDPIGEPIYGGYRADGTNIKGLFRSRVIAKVTDVEPFDIEAVSYKRLTYIYALTRKHVARLKHVRLLRTDTGFRRKAVDMAEILACKLCTADKKVYLWETPLLREAAVYLLRVQGVKLDEERQGSLLVSITVRD